MLHEGLKGTFLSTNGLDGWLVTNISIGMAYSSFRSLFVQVGLLGFMRIIAFGYQKYFLYIIYKCYKKRELTKKTHWLLKQKRFEKVTWIWSHHLQWKFKLCVGEFAWGIKAKHCWALSRNFWKQIVCWHHPPMFCCIILSKLSRQ